MRNTVIIGGGAAGLMAAAVSAGNGCRVTVIEKNNRCGRKLMITGKGRCNVTNNCDRDTLIANTVKNPRFLYSAFSEFGSSDTMAFFENAGVALKTERGKRVFPVSDKAVDIVDALVKTAVSAGVRIINARAVGILCGDGKVKGVKLSDGGIIQADSILIATGGRSYPVTGSTGDGYKFAAACGHTVSSIGPSLVPLCCREKFCSELSGLSLRNVTLALYEKGRSKPVHKELGEMLFTHFGISGPLVLTASAYINNYGRKEYTCVIDLKPALSNEQLDSRIIRDFKEVSNKNFSNSLDRLLPKSLVPVIINLSGIDRDIKVNRVSRQQRQKLVETIKNFTLHIEGARPVDEAIITRGGVSVKEIDPRTMQSKIISGLYFAGEVIDTDALTGGFNLQIAFSTGFTAGKNM